MTTIKATLIALSITAPALAFSLPSQSAMLPHIETALVNICKAAQSNKVYRLKSTIKSYGLKEKTVALKVMCNGDDIITFSKKSGAIKTAATLLKSLDYLSIGELTITDIAAAKKEAQLLQDNNYAKNQ